MDISQMEKEAERSALRQVAAMLQRPDQLEKLDQFKKRSLRKKAAVDAMLKTAVQSQLEGVRVGLGQLKAAKQDIQVLSECFEEISAHLKDFWPLQEKLKLLKEESEKHSQCAAAMENLKTIYDIQNTIHETFQELSQGKLLHAHKHLMELEQARDDVMLEVFKMQSGSEYDLNMLKAYFSEIDKIAQEMEKQLNYVFSRALEAVRGTDPGPQQFVTALRIVEREERIDKICEDRHKSTNFMPIGRPRKWRQMCFATIFKMVRERIEKHQVEDRELNKHWLARYLELCRLSIPQDLKIVKSGCESCFPPDYDIYSRFVDFFHKALVEKLREIAAETSEKNEIIQLLSWLRVYASADMLGHPYLAIDVRKLLIEDPLLSIQTIDALVRKFVELTEKDLGEWLERTLTQEKDSWYAQTLPEMDANGFYYTSLPSILFPMVEDQIQLAREINAEIIPHIIMVNVDQLLTFTARYKDAMQAFKNKHFEDRSRFTAFTKIMISAANDCQTCIESSERLKTHIRVAVESDAVTVQSPRASITSVRQLLLVKIDMLKERWTNNCKTAVNFLFEEIFADLTKHLEEILTRTWFGSPVTFDTICATIDDYYQDHKHLKPTLLNSLLMDIQCRVVKEFVKAMESRRISFKDHPERKIAADQMIKESEVLKNAFSHLAPSSGGVDKFEPVTDVIAALAEIVKLGDKSLLSLEMSSFVRKFPDVTQDQLSGVLMTREDFNRLEAPRLAQEILDHNRFRPKETGPYSRLFK